jgi:adenosylmethionine-8-amino-7-oxononanoate aminotransferase
LDRYASIGAVLMSKRIADGIRDGSGFWQHGHTYQVESTRFAKVDSLSMI